MSAAPVLQTRAGEGVDDSVPPPLSAEALRARLESFAADSMRGRPAGTSIRSMVDRYLMDALRSFGARPLGDGGSYFQRFALVSGTLDLRRTMLNSDFPTGVALRPANLVLGIDFLPLAGILGLPFPTHAASSARVVYGGRLGDRHAISNDAVAGRFVVLEPPIRPDGEPDYQLWGHLNELKAFSHAKALFVNSLDLMPPSVARYWLGPHIDLGGVGDVSGEIPPVVAISAAAANLLLEANIGEVPIRSTSERTAERLAGLEFRLTRADLPVRGTNVLAMIPGSDTLRQSEFVVIMAHTDGFGGVLASARSTGLRRGANVGGTGSVALLAIAEHFAEIDPKPLRSVIFVWTDADEDGLLGSTWFADHLPVQRSHVVATINVDMIGRSGAEPDVVEVLGARNRSSELRDWTRDVSRQPDIALRIDDRSDSRGDPDRGWCTGGQSKLIGIPGIFVTGGARPDSSDAPASISYEYFARVTRLIDAIARHLADAATVPQPDRSLSDALAQCQ